MKKIKGQYRQGDVLIDENLEIPKTATKQKGGRIILAHGEATGHAHEIDIDDAEAWKDGEETVGVEVLKPTKIKHQEHGPIPVAPKKHSVNRQVEYSPQTIRPVAD